MLALVLLALIVGAFVWLKPAFFDWRLFGASLLDVHPGWLLAGVLTTLFGYVVRAFRWGVLLSEVKSIPAARLVSGTIIGFGLICLLGRAGELARPIWLNRREGVSFSAAFGTIVVERFLDAIMLVAVFALVMAWIQLPANALPLLDQLQEAAVVSAAILAIGMGGIFAFHANVERIGRWIPFPRLRTMIHNLAAGFGSVRQGRHLALSLAYSGGLWFVIALEFWLLLLGLRFDLGFLEATLVTVAVSLGSLAQIPGIGGGFQAAFVFSLTRLFGVSAEKALAGSLLIWVLSYGPTILIAAGCMVNEGLSLRDLSRNGQNPSAAEAPAFPAKAADEIHPL